MIESRWNNRLVLCGVIQDGVASRYGQIYGCKCFLPHAQLWRVTAAKQRFQAAYMDMVASFTVCMHDVCCGWWYGWFTLTVWTSCDSFYYQFWTSVYDSLSDDTGAILAPQCTYMTLWASKVVIGWVISTVSREIELCSTFRSTIQPNEFSLWVIQQHSLVVYSRANSFVD